MPNSAAFNLKLIRERNFQREEFSDLRSSEVNYYIHHFQLAALKVFLSHPRQLTQAFLTLYPQLQNQSLRWYAEMQMKYINMVYRLTE